MSQRCSTSHLTRNSSCGDKPNFPDVHLRWYWQPNSL